MVMPDGKVSWNMNSKMVKSYRKETGLLFPVLGNLKPVKPKKLFR
jgi:hypothetical protein